MSIYFNACISTSIKVSNAPFIDSVSVTFFSYCAHSLMMSVVKIFLYFGMCAGQWFVKFHSKISFKCNDKIPKISINNFKAFIILFYMTGAHMINQRIT